MKRVVVCAMGALAASGSAMAQVDGSRGPGEYGPAAAVQTVQTGFGDNLNELNAAYARIAGGRLHLLLTGNLQANFNKLEIFIDSRAGGQQTLNGAPGNDNSGNMNGLTFDSGFTADYHLIARRGFNGMHGVFELDFAELGTPNFNTYGNVFGGQDFGAGSTGTGVNASPIDVAYNGSNAGGVTGGSGPADQMAALAVTTGLELSIDLADLGSPAGEFRVLAFVNNQDHNYASNQFLGGLMAPQGNLGSDGSGNFTGVANFNLNNFAGDQWFVVPAPGAAALAGAAGLLSLRRRRRI